MSAHASDPELAAVWDPGSGRRFQLPQEALDAARHFDGRRSLQAVAETIEQEGGPWISESVLAQLAADLDALDLLGTGVARRAPAAPQPQWEVEPAPARLPIEVHPEARFACEGVGSCCRSGYLIPLDSAGVKKIQRAAKNEGIEGELVVLTPSRPGASWTWALDNDPSCPFLAPENRCRLHGRSAHPPACRTFPLAFVRLGVRVLATITHRCGCGALGRGPKLSQRKASLAAKMRQGPVPRVPARLRLDDERDGGLAVPEGWVDVAVRGGSAVEMVDRAFASLGVEAARHPLPLDLDGIRRRLREGLGEDEDVVLQSAVGGGHHPLAETHRQDLRAAEMVGSQDEVEGELRRFVRDHLFGLRPLHHGTLARGLFALSVALADLQKRRAQGHLETRVALMMWEDAFAAPGWRGLMGPEGPFGVELADAGRARRWARQLLESS
ncbi:MAG: hypothetical protein AAGD10_18550 [Myxococcota bacterium]